MSQGARRLTRASNGRTPKAPENIDAIGMSIPGTRLSYESPAQLAQDLDNVSRANAEYLRFDIAWVQIEGTKGALYWDNIDRIVAGALARGQKMIGIITTLAPWARAATGDWQLGPHNAR